MDNYQRHDLDDRELQSNLTVHRAGERSAIATVLADIGEFDARRLFLPAAYPSMHAYCMAELGYSKAEAYKRIEAARAAREYPVIFVALAEGRHHLSGVVMLAPRLTPGNADELLSAAAGKSKTEIQLLLAERFPRPDVPERVQAIGSSQGATELLTQDEFAPGRIPALSAGPLAPGDEHPIVAPLSSERYEFHFSGSRNAYETLRYIQTLLSHRPAERELPEVFESALELYQRHLEKGKFAATTRPRAGSRLSTSPRYIPAAVKHAVWERDGGRCTFTSDSGKRCSAESLLEFDHEVPVARGGQSTVENIRLRCRAHNQYAAECAFGAGFMSDKREEARARAASRPNGHAPGRVEPTPPSMASAGPSTQFAPGRIEAKAAEPANDRDVVPYLMHLGCRAADARRVAAQCDEALPEGSLEERLRFALRRLAPPHRKEPAMAT